VVSHSSRELAIPGIHLVHEFISLEEEKVKERYCLLSFSSINYLGLLFSLQYEKIHQIFLLSTELLTIGAISYKSGVSLSSIWPSLSYLS
jgi:hypothetical protein